MSFNIYVHNHLTLEQALIIQENSGLREAPPTRSPSTELMLRYSWAFLPFALPPYMILILSALGFYLPSLFRSQSKTYLVCSGEEDTPVPMAHTGSQASTIELVQAAELEGKAAIKGFSWVSRTSQVLFAFLSELQRLTEAVDDVESIIKCVLGLGDDKLVIFADDGPPLGMAQDYPLEPEILEVLGADLAGVGAEPVVGRILGSNLDIWVLERGLDCWDVQVDGGDDDVDQLGVELQIIDGVVDQGDGLLEGVVRLPVAADDELVAGEEAPAGKGPHAKYPKIINRTDSLQFIVKHHKGPRLYYIGLPSAYNRNIEMSNLTAQVPRSLKFNQNSIRNFVHGSSFLNSTSMLPEKANFDNNMAKTSNDFRKNPKGFDFYNRNNLLLRACNAQDIQYVCRNPVVYEQEIKVAPAPAQKQNNVGMLKARTVNNFYIKQAESTEQPKKSKEAEVNDFLFNYRKMEEEKKSKKLKFLQEMQNKISHLQKQTFQLQAQKGKQYDQLNSILKINQDLSEQGKKADLLSKINQAIYEANTEEQKAVSPRKLQEGMGYLEINMAIEQHHQYNNALLDQIQRVSRSKSKDRAAKPGAKAKELSPKKTGMGKTNSSNHQFSKTLKRPNQVPPRPTSSKKLTSTWKGSK